MQNWKWHWENDGSRHSFTFHFLLSQTPKENTNLNNTGGKEIVCGLPFSAVHISRVASLGGLRPFALCSPRSTLLSSLWKSLKFRMKKRLKLNHITTSKNPDGTLLFSSLHYQDHRKDHPGRLSIEPGMGRGGIYSLGQNVPSPLLF